MSITKAFLLTLLLTFISYSIQVISLIGFDQSEFSHDYSEQIFGVTLIVSRVVAYLSIFYFFWRKKLGLNQEGFRNFDPKILLYLVLMTFGLRLIGEPFWDFDPIFRSVEVPFYEFEGISPGFIYRSISILLISPILEELFFRKFLISELLKKNSKAIAVFVSALLFAAIHWETITNLVPAFIFGILGGIIFIRTQKVIYLICLHFLYNLLTVLINVNGSQYFEVVNWLDYGFLYWTLFIFGIILTLFALRQIPSEARTNDHSIQ